jgi:cytochrome c oxidase subunit 2
MGKLFAVTLVVVALLSAAPIVMHTWAPPVDISAHGKSIDKQMAETMVEAGVAFLAAQLLLGIFVWRSSSRHPDAKVRGFPGGAKGLIIAGFFLVGAETLTLGVPGQKAWAQMYFAPAGADALPIQVQAGQFAFYFRYPGADGKFGPLHPEKIDEGAQNFFGLDPDHDADSRDDIVTAQMAVPLDREIHLLMHAKDVGHSFYVRELRLQQDFVPGLDLSLHFTATRIGRYEIVCTQLCGLGHYNMKAYLEVMSQSDFDQWVKQQAALQ